MKNWCKLAIITDEVSQELDDVLRFAAEFKLDGIEVRSLFGRAFKDLTRDDLSLIAKKSRDAGFAIAGAASPVFKCNLDAPDEIAAHIELFKKSVEAAQTLGTDIVRVFAFLRKSHPATGDELKRAASHFPKLLDIVRGTNIRIGIENEASCIMGNGAETAEFCKHLPESDQWGIVWDPCNCIYLEGANDPIRDDFPPIADKVIHFHVKDAARAGTKPALKCCELGKGSIDFAGHIRDLKARGYHGWIALETHWRSIPLDDAIQHLPAGYSFSANAEPASRICMATLQRWIAEA